MQVAWQGSFSLVSHKIIEKLFEGNPEKILPKISANTILCEIYVAVEKVITHSIVHGFHIFSFEFG